jgi:SRSO17 transposase
MDSTDFDRLYEAFGAFHTRFAPYFGRREARERSEQYVRGLLVQKSERRSAENLAEAVPGATPRALQRFLTESPWPTEPVVGELQALVGERLSDPEGVFIPDETGFPKQGKKSVGVTRQYSGTLGQTGNCQVGVFLAYASSRGHALVDGRLYLPEPWTQDPARCRAAGVPEERLGFRTKPELALETIRAAIARGHLEARWVTADEVYGNSPIFRDGLDACGLFYVLEVQNTMPVFEEWAEARLPVWSGRGRPPTQRRLVAGAKPARKARQVRAGLPPSAWHLLMVSEGSQGPRRYRFAAVRIWESRGRLPGPGAWLLFREKPDGTEPRFYLSNAPPDTPLQKLAKVASVRWAVEEEFQTLKGECGLDEYEVRSWGAWHHHVVLALLAGAFLLELEQSWGKKQRHTPAPHPPAGGTRAGGVTTPRALDEGRAPGVAPDYPGEERAGSPLPRQAPSAQSPAYAA